MHPFVYLFHTLSRSNRQTVTQLDLSTTMTSFAGKITLGLYHLLWRFGPSRDRDYFHLADSDYVVDAPLFIHFPSPPFADHRSDYLHHEVSKETCPIRHHHYRFHRPQSTRGCRLDWAWLLRRSICRVVVGDCPTCPS